MSIAILPIVSDDFSTWLESQPAEVQAWTRANHFKAKPAGCCLIPGDNGEVTQVLLGVKDAQDFWSFGALPKKLLEGEYKIEAKYDDLMQQRIAMAWRLGCYQYDRYKKMEPIKARLIGLDQALADAQPLVESFYLARDLINTPTEDMHTEQLAQAVLKVAQEFNADVKQIIGDDLLTENYPLIHAVGRAAKHPPRLIDLRWGNKKHPKVTLVCKGIVYDTGGLSLKPSKGMLPMKKDMGGSAIGLALARVIMALNLPIQLRLLISAAENAISCSSYRPGDVFRARNGKTVEVTNTDAEGRLVMADALVEACSEKPDYLFDFSTLTGAARVAVGTDVAAFFCNNEKFADDIKQAGRDSKEFIWQLPLYQGYRVDMDSDIADIRNSGDSPYGDATKAALFLQEFVEPDVSWCHFDLMASNARDLPGRPKGGEAQALRAVLEFLKQHYHAPA